MTELAIQTQKLTRTFGNLTAVDSIDLRVAAGQFFGFLGPNGAGKSTTINLKFVGRMYGLDRATTQRRSEELLDFMQLADRPKTMIADYSHGMQKKLALAAAVIHGPRILFLDEPFEGVDALAAGALKALLARMTERGTTIFLTSHVLEIVERLCSHVAIIHEGRLVAQGSLEELRAGISGEAGDKTTLEQIFLSIVGQDGAERPQLEELSWLM